ncbi:MAG TPA: UDP-N-acetylmuramoyl-L-alanyl-D-glutamate--2,6-diaminopimelate ligase [Candidatus Baltobacteraceae bacterium]|jgi:UDP-N-acetylmuramoyl-L-alanyl-D-glutamate--2,6-diaminopimelate ligase
MMPLARLLEAIPDANVDGPVDGVAITALAADSRNVAPGAMFVAIAGEHVDGHRFLSDAIAAGARAIVVDRKPVDGRATIIRVADTRIALSRLAARFYGEPSHKLRVIGITGTNGKTTTTHMTRALLDACGIRSGYVGTLGASYGEWTRGLQNTTPLPIELQETLATMLDLGAKAVTMEVSSHALALHRVDDIRFTVGAFTNLTRDHLDFHLTIDAYAAAKRRLFDLAERAVLDVDDPHGANWASELRSRGTPVVTYALDAPADLRATDVELRPDASTFAVDGARVEVPLPGRFNVRNALCALAIARSLELDLNKAATALHGLPPVPGRMERYARDGVVAIVDYAHTPDALANVLRATRETMDGGKLFVVFGCGGDRDAGKRPQMGTIASNLADVVIVTNDNPRSEDPLAIAREILAGAPNAEVELDRRVAIRAAIKRARKGDVVVVAGKGHEDYQIIGAARTHFDDRDEVRAALA